MRSETPLDLAALLPGIAVAQSFGDPAGQHLFPAEEPAVATAVTERVNEYTTARACARRALATLGIEPVAIVNDADGVPQWPVGVVGSITHCRGYRAAAVASLSTVAGLGIDAEPHRRMPAGVLAKVASRSEIGRLAPVSGVAVDLVLWSAKEAAYKAWFPITRCWVPPQQLEVTLQLEVTGQLEVTEQLEVTVRPDLTAAGGSFLVLVTPPAQTAVAGCMIQGRWLANADFVLAAAAIPA